MKIVSVITVFSLAGALASPALAQAPATPPPDSGIRTPYDGERESAPDAYPSASIGPERCAGQSARPVLENGAATPGPLSPPGELAGATPGGGPAARGREMSIAAMRRRSAANDPTWCEGAYRPDAGTNFGE